MSRNINFFLIFILHYFLPFIIIYLIIYKYLIQSILLISLFNIFLQNLWDLYSLFKRVRLVNFWCKYFKSNVFMLSNNNNIHQKDVKLPFFNIICGTTKQRSSLLSSWILICIMSIHNKFSIKSSIYLLIGNYWYWFLVKDNVPRR